MPVWHKLTNWTYICNCFALIPGTTGSNPG